MKSSSHEIYRHTAIDLEVISAIKVQSECAQATQSKEEGTPKSDPELMKLKNSNMERSDLLCPGSNEKSPYSVYGAQDPYSVKVTSNINSRSCAFSRTQLLHLKTLHLTFFCVVSGMFPLSHFFSAFCAHFPRGYHTRPCIVIIISPSSHRDSEAKGASRCLWKRVGKGN